MNMESSLSMQIRKAYLRKIHRSLIMEYIFIFVRQIFCDFGEEFEVLDTNGENPTMQIVTEISHVRIR